MDTKEQISIMQAYVDGKTIQMRNSSKEDWLDIVNKPIWNWGIHEYRIKPELNLPSTWKEFCETHRIQLNEAVIDNCSQIQVYEEDTLKRCCIMDKNILPNKQLAEAMLALCQLIQLRDNYNQGWKPDWTDDTFKYVIYTYDNEIVDDHDVSRSAILAFKSKELRDQFLKNFRELIEIAKPLL